jgi:hypothetical protein
MDTFRQCPVSFTQYSLPNKGMKGVFNEEIRLHLPVWHSTRRRHALFSL